MALDQGQIMGNVMSGATPYTSLPPEQRMLLDRMGSQPTTSSAVPALPLTDTVTKSNLPSPKSNLPMANSPENQLRSFLGTMSSGMGATLGPPIVNAGDKAGGALQKSWDMFTKIFPQMPDPKKDPEGFKQAMGRIGRGVMGMGDLTGVGTPPISSEDYENLNEAKKVLQQTSDDVTKSMNGYGGNDLSDQLKAEIQSHVAEIDNKLNSSAISAVQPPAAISGGRDLISEFNDAIKSVGEPTGREKVVDIAKQIMSADENNQTLAPLKEKVANMVMGTKPFAPIGSLGDMQMSNQVASGNDFLANFDKAINKGDTVTANNILNSLPDGSPYKQSLQSVLATLVKK